MFIAIAIALLHVAGVSRVEFRAWVDRWSVAEWAVALGTLTLAGFTLTLALEAKRQIAFQRDEAEAAIRPIVYPIATVEWMRADIRSGHLVIRNGGLGPAVLVEGIIEWNDPGASPKPQIAVWPSGGLGPGEERMNRLAKPGVGDWHNARGSLWYTDVNRGRWQTDFSCQIETGDIVVLRVGAITRIGPND